MPFAYESPGKLLKVRFCSSDFSNKSRGNSNGRWPGQPGALAGFSHVQRQAMGLQDGEARAPGAGHSWSQQAPMAPWASRESRWCSYSSASVVGYPARIRELNSTIFMGLFQLEIFYDSVTITPTSTQGNPLGLFSLAEQSLGPSERSLQLQQDERCKDSVDKHSQLWQTGYGRAMATKVTMENSGGTKWQSFSLGGWWSNEVQPQVSTERQWICCSWGFLKVKAMAFPSRC